MGLFKTALLQSRVPDYPNDDWTTVADVPTGARVLDGGVLKQKRQVFRNAGTDFVESTNPAVISALQPSSSYTVEVVFASNTAINTFYQILGTANRMFLFAQDQVNDSYSVTVGNASRNLYTITRPANGVYAKGVIEVGASNIQLTINNQSQGGVSMGATVASNNIIYINKSDGGFLNYEGDIASISFYAGIGASKTFVDEYDFTDPTKFDGVTIISEQGYVGTVTDGTPISALGYALVPVEYL